MEFQTPNGLEALRRSLIGAFLLWVLYMMIAGGCTGAYHIRKAERHLDKARRKNPELFHVDTLVVRDTIWIETPVVDTVTQLKTDTIQEIVFKDSTIVRYYVKKDSIWLEVDCPDCPEITETRTVKEQVFVQPTFGGFIKKYWWAFIPWLLIIGGIVLSILKKQINPFS